MLYIVTVLFTLLSLTTQVWIRVDVSGMPRFEYINDDMEWEVQEVIMEKGHNYILTTTSRSERAPGDESESYTELYSTPVIQEMMTENEEENSDTVNETVEISQKDDEKRNSSEVDIGNTSNDQDSHELYSEEETIESATDKKGGHGPELEMRHGILEVGEYNTAEDRRRGETSEIQFDIGDETDYLESDKETETTRKIENDFDSQVKKLKAIEFDLEKGKAREPELKDEDGRKELLDHEMMSDIEIVKEVLVEGEEVESDEYESGQIRDQTIDGQTMLESGKPGEENINVTEEDSVREIIEQKVEKGRILNSMDKVLGGLLKNMPKVGKEKEIKVPVTTILASENVQEEITHPAIDTTMKMVEVDKSTKTIMDDRSTVTNVPTSGKTTGYGEKDEFDLYEDEGEYGVDEGGVGDVGEEYGDHPGEPHQPSHLTDIDDGTLKQIYKIF